MEFSSFSSGTASAVKTWQVCFVPQPLVSLDADFLLT